LLSKFGKQILPLEKNPTNSEAMMKTTAKKQLELKTRLQK
jgi:hypothetical protein